jgi:predicted porin
MGVMVFNNTPFWGRFSYSAAVINWTGQNVRDTNDAKDVVGRLVTLVPGAAGISVGVNGQAGRQVGGMRKRWGADLNVDRGNYHVMAEYLHETRDIWQGLAGHGFYVLATRRFHPETQRAGFYMAEAVLRLSETRDPSPVIADGTAGARLRQVQAGGNYYFSRNVRVMADASVPFNRPAGAPRATIVTRVQFIF